MGADRACKSLGDFFELQRGTTYKGVLKGQPGPVLLGLASIQRNGGFRQDNVTTYGGDSPEKLLVRSGELFVSLKDVTQAGDLLGAVAMVPPQVDVGRLTQDTVKLVPKSADAPLDYLHWLLRAPQVRALCRSRATGTTNLGLAREDFLSIPVPSLTPTRKRITSLLRALDNKIDLNRRMNRTLEAMAQAIFKSWFIDFDGHTDFVDSELGPIPSGWVVQPLDQIARFLNGLALQNYPPTGSRALPVIKIRELNQGVGADSDLATADVPPEYIVRDGDLLFSWSGSLVVRLWTGGLGALNQHLFKVTSDRYPQWFYYRWLLHHLAEFRNIAADKATTMGHIQRKHLSAALTLVPTEQVLAAMTATMRPLLARQITADLESRTLAALRDTLLPKLISGEIRVPEALEVIQEGS